MLLLFSNMQCQPGLACGRLFSDLFYLNGSRFCVTVFAASRLTYFIWIFVVATDLLSVGGATWWFQLIVGEWELRIASIFLNHHIIQRCADRLGEKLRESQPYAGHSSTKSGRQKSGGNICNDHCSSWAASVFTECSNPITADFKRGADTVDTVTKAQCCLYRQPTSDGLEDNLAIPWRVSLKSLMGFCVCFVVAAELC